MVSPSSPSFSRKTILVVDSDPAQRRQTLRQLDLLGLPHVVEAQNSLAATLLLSAGVQPDAMMIALDLPWVSGLEVAKTIRQGEAAVRATLPIAITASLWGARLAEACRDLDCLGPLITPLSRGSLEEVLGELWRRTPSFRPAAAYRHVQIHSVLPPLPQENAPEESWYSGVAFRPPAELPIAAYELEAGMVLSRAVCLTDGRILVEAGLTITEDLRATILRAAQTHELGILWIAGA